MTPVRLVAMSGLLIVVWVALANAAAADARTRPSVSAPFVTGMDVRSQTQSAGAAAQGNRRVGARSGPADCNGNNFNITGSGDPGSQVNGTVLTLTCLLGYNDTGCNQTMMACNDGSWVQVSGPTAYCDPIALCETVTGLPAGQENGTCNDGAVGDKCQLSCTPDNYAANVTMGTCVASSATTAEWQGQSITCRLIGTNCALPTLPANANVGTCQTLTPGGGNCTLGCNLGYNGTATRGTCSFASPNYRFTNLTATCTPMNCSITVALATGVLPGNCSRGVLKHTCRVACADGYGENSFSPTDLDATCDVLTGSPPGTPATWQGVLSTGCAGCCSAKKCPTTPPLPPNGSGTCPSAQTSFGNRCTGTCKNGYTVSGNTTFVCQPGVGPTAVWVSPPDLYSCIPKQCTDPPVVTKSTAGNCTSLDVLSTCTIGCEDGYSLTGGQYLCTPATAQDGAPSWQVPPGGTASQCSSVFCAPMNESLVPENAGSGTCGQAGTLGSTCQLVCADGYSSTGAISGTCTAGTGATAYWADMAITCAVTPASTASSIVDPNAGGSSSSSLIGPIVGALAGVIVVLFIIVVIVIIRRRKNRGQDGDGTIAFNGNPDATNLVSNYASGTYDSTMDSSRGFTLKLNDETQVKNWDDFEIIRELGAGAFGKVYQVREKKTYTDMALKVFKNVRTNDEVASFVREANVLLNLHHQHCLACFGLMQHDNELGLLMEFMGGGDLKGAISKLNKAKKAQALSDACKGLAYLHTRNLVHGDIKPGNILLDASGVAKLADFGVTGAVGVGFTERYAAPEVLKGEKPNAPTDIYSYGLTIAEVYIGKQPFDKMKEARRQNQDIDPYDKLDAIPPNIRVVVEKCLALDPNARPPAADIIKVLNE